LGHLGDNRRVAKNKHRGQAAGDSPNELPQPAEPGPGQPIPWPRPIRERAWTDADGVRWIRRGSSIAGNDIRRLLLDASIPVLLCYSLEPRIVPPVERAELWDRIRPYVTGRLRDDATDHTSFDTAEFRDDERRSMLIIEESC